MQAPRTVLGLVVLAWCVGCGDDQGNPPPVGSGGTTTGPITTSSTTATDTATGTGDETGTTPLTCDDLACGEGGVCEEGEGGADAQCVCNLGYKLAPGGLQCEFDDECIQLRLLDEDCRQRPDGFPAVGAFFAVDYCTGDAVVPADLESLGLQFQVLENGVDIEENVESSAVIIDKDVESYVTLAIDASDSVATSQDLPLLIDELRGLVQDIAPDDNAPVYVSIQLFGRTQTTYVPFTQDLASVDTALQQLVTDLQSNNNPINPMGTNLYDAVEETLDDLYQIRSIRRAATAGGVLTMGTLVVVTDAEDTSGGTLELPESAATQQILTIGISSDVDAEELQTIGRDGAFFAPEPADWPAAFNAITKRVDEYPDRTYLLAYCSSVTVGQPTVEVTLIKPGFRGWGPPVSTASCVFDADRFAEDPPVCNAAELTDECQTRSCGGLTACGACADNECCSAFEQQCEAPQSVADVGAGCAGSHQLCGPDGACVDDACVTPPAQGEACTDTCMPGETYCTTICEPALALGAECTSPLECASLHCGPNPMDQFGPFICKPPVELFEECGATLASCPIASYCDTSTDPGLCLEQKPVGEACESNAQCLSGECGVPPGLTESVCVGNGICHVTWEQAF